MKLGVMGAGLGAMGWDRALDYCQKVGLDAIELPVGCFPGTPFFDPEEVVKSRAAQRQSTAAASSLERWPPGPWIRCLRNSG